MRTDLAGVERVIAALARTTIRTNYVWPKTCRALRHILGQQNRVIVHPSHAIVSQRGYFHNDMLLNTRIPINILVSLGKNDTEWALARVGRCGTAGTAGTR